MNKNTKALLASTFIVPGAGQFLLKRYKSAALLISSAVAVVTLILIDVMSKAWEIVDRIMLGEVEPKLLVIRKLVAEQQANSDSQWIVWASSLFILIWLVSIIDVYRMRR